MKKGHSPVTRVKKSEPNIESPNWVIWAAWADRITFEEIKKKTGISESEVIKVMRKKIIELIKKIPKYDIQEKDFSPYELISADEIWVTNSISGIIPVTEYRRKSFTNNIGNIIINYFNKKFAEF